MIEPTLHVVTGAFGYSGRYIAQRLLDCGHRVRTLTNSVDRENAFQGRVEAMPYHFDAPDRLTESLRGVAVLYNTYWVRFNHRRSRMPRRSQHADFVRGRQAGRRRTHRPREHHQPVRRFPVGVLSRQSRPGTVASGKWHSAHHPAAHGAVRQGGHPGQQHCLDTAAIARVGVFGDGQYRLQPIYVDDLAKLAVEQGAASGSRTLDAIGPETFTYRELVRTVGEIIGKRRPIISVAPLSDTRSPGPSASSWATSS